MTRRDAPSIQQAQLLFQQGHTEAARQATEQVLRADPSNVDALMMLMVFAKARGDLAGIERIVVSALARHPDNRRFLAVRAENLFHKGEPRKAIEVCDEGLNRFHNASEFIMVKALSHEIQSEFAEAWTTIEPSLQDGSASPDFYAIAGRVLHGLGRFQELIALTRPLAERADVSRETRERIWFQLAKTFDRLGQFDDAIEAAARAHSVSGVPFDLPSFDALVDDLISTFSGTSLRTLARSTVDSELPVFVVGMPRSGTTLVEQIIHAHPQGAGAGEILDIEVAAKTLPTQSGSFYPYPAAVVDVTPELANRYASEYVSRLKAIAPRAHRVVNKMLEQYLHVGLIWMLLPRARVIHVRRDAMDTCLSCYMRHLNPRRMPYTRSLEHLAHVYRQHERLMDHWKNTLDVPIFTLQYEDLIVNQEQVSRDIFEFLGLDWNEQCLRYWESDRTAMTLSYDQVNKPIYDSSVGRWKNYEKHLGPLTKALATDR